MSDDAREVWRVVRRLMEMKGLDSDKKVFIANLVAAQFLTGETKPPHEAMNLILDALGHSSIPEPGN